MDMVVGHAIRYWTSDGRRNSRTLFIRWILFAVFVHLNTAGRVSCEFSQEDEYTLACVNLTYVDAATKKWHTEKEEIGKFGEGIVDKVSGLIVHVSSKNGTSNWGCQVPFDNQVPKKEPWIALIRRGECPFTQKISNAAKQNASAVVVYDDKTGPMQKMVYRVPKIVSVFIPQDHGERIAELVDNGTSVYMYITVGTRQSVRYTINRTPVLFVSISFIVLMIISLAWLIFYYVQRFRYINAKDQLARQLCSATKKALAKIPLKTIKDSDTELECCAVCIEPYKPSDVIRILPCKHQFHRNCIDPWLLDQRTCPMCKMDILKFYGLVYTGSQESVLQLDVEEGVSTGNGEQQLVITLPLDTSRHASQEECGLPTVSNAANQRSQNNQNEQPKQVTGQPECGQISSANNHQTHPQNQIDCIMITMLENSPMASRLSHNRNIKMDTESLTNDSSGTNAALADMNKSTELSNVAKSCCDQEDETIEHTDAETDCSLKETKDFVEVTSKKSNSQSNPGKTSESHNQELT